MGQYENNVYRFKIEIKSVNHRYCDILVKMPRHIGYLEDDIKKIIKGKINRGKIDVYINLEYIDESSLDISIDIPLAKAYKSAIEELSSALGLDDSFSLENILDIPDIIKIEKRAMDEELLAQSLKIALDMALDNMLNMRLLEGRELGSDILLKLENIQRELDIIENRAPMLGEEYRDRLRERVRELLDDDIILDEDRLSNEVAFLLIKVVLMKRL